MASAAYQSLVTPETPIVIKITLDNNSVRKLKLPLKDLGANTLLQKLREFLEISPEDNVTFERFSDSVGGYILLDQANPAVFKTLIRAAKAKLKLRIKASVSSRAAAVATATEAKTELVSKDNAVVAESEASVLASSDPKLRDNMADVIERQARSSQDIKGLLKEQTDAAHQKMSPSAMSSNSFGLSKKTTERSDAAAAPSLQTLFHQLSKVTPEPVIAKCLLPTSVLEQGAQWSIYCNECDQPTGSVHFHCNICEKGDFDLCEACVAAGKLCTGEGHWLIKRFVKDGVITNSTTERLAPKRSTTLMQTLPEVPTQIPGHFDGSHVPSEKPSSPQASTSNPFLSRTCNSCVVVLPDSEFVNCTKCDDFDLCVPCHTQNTHGHHPGHRFQKVSSHTTLSPAATMMMSPGRNLRHEAICDTCNNVIYGVRHKCLTCPDFDLCHACIDEANRTHPRHRFAPIYDQLARATSSGARHVGIYCDGLLCKNKKTSCITGHRYKCAICHDTDFCAACEASPHNKHNKSHPLILFKTPVRNVMITTQNEDIQGNVRTLGDREVSSDTTEAKVASSEPVRAAPNLNTKLQVLADFVPTEQTSTPVNAQQQITPPVDSPAKVSLRTSVADTLMQAAFVRDSIPDGMGIIAGSRFTQVWTLRNDGPVSWPAGCSLRYVGGDNMLDVDHLHPASVDDIKKASESNVIAREVQVGEEVAFKITLKAPSRIGSAISYWRLKTDNGVAFGHRLWCDISVQPKNFAVSEADRTLLSPMTLQSARSAAPHHDAVRPESPQVKDPSSEEARAARKQYQDRLLDAHRVQVAKHRAAMIKARIEQDRLTQQNTLAMQTADAYTLSVQEKQARKKQQKLAEDETELPMRGSLMVFPRLDKESPESSTYQSTPSAEDTVTAEHADDNDKGENDITLSPVSRRTTATLERPGSDRNDDLTDDLEVLSADSEFGNSDEEDGFLTDEEYDILDASDRETIASP